MRNEVVLPSCIPRTMVTHRSVKDPEHLRGAPDICFLPHGPLLHFSQIGNIAGTGRVNKTNGTFSKRP